MAINDENNYQRPLNTALLTAVFVIGVLDLKDDEAATAINRITEAEIGLAAVAERSTLKSRDFRDYRYVEEAQRRELRQRIVEELLSKKRYVKDDAIRLGGGGALPHTKLKSERHAYILIGLPASGKSSVATKVADEYGCVIVDSDFAKRKFPEFALTFGASLVHDESALVVFGDQENYPTEYSVMGYCLNKGHNLVIPKIGNNEAAIVELAESLQAQHYSVHLTLVSLDRKEATKRAYRRFLSTNRYVSLSLVFDLFSNDPVLTYYRLKEKQNAAFATYGKISTDVPQNTKFAFVAGPSANPAALYQ